MKTALQVAKKEKIKLFWQHHEPTDNHYVGTSHVLYRFKSAVPDAVRKLLATNGVYQPPENPPACHTILPETPTADLIPLVDTKLVLTDPDIPVPVRLFITKSGQIVIVNAKYVEEMEKICSGIIYQSQKSPVEPLIFGNNTGICLPLRLIPKVKDGIRTLVRSLQSVNLD
jgi:hypothetical protein